jgi:RNA polymerase sigma factor (TIGR02999 family)
MPAVTESLTQLLGQWRGGNSAAQAQLLEQIYPMMRALAAKQVRAVGGHLTLSPTELAHEAFIKLGGQNEALWESRSHYLAMVATVIRHVVVDYLRERGADKRHGDKVLVAMDDKVSEEFATGLEAFGWIRVNETLSELAELDGECARVVELKLFSEMDAEQIAQACDCSVSTVGRHWRFAKAWLAQALSNQ